MKWFGSRVQEWETIDPNSPEYLGIHKASQRGERVRRVLRQGLFSGRLPAILFDNESGTQTPIPPEHWGSNQAKIPCYELKLPISGRMKSGRVLVDAGEADRPSAEIGASPAFAGPADSAGAAQDASPALDRFYVAPPVGETKGARNNRWVEMMLVALRDDGKAKTNKVAAMISRLEAVNYGTVEKVFTQIGRGKLVANAKAPPKASRAF